MIGRTVTGLVWAGYGSMLCVLFRLIWRDWRDPERDRRVTAAAAAVSLAIAAAVAAAIFLLFG